MTISITPEQFETIDAALNAADAALRQLQAENEALRKDALRWRFYEEHAQSYWNGRKLGDYLVFDGVMKFGSRNACIDAAMTFPKPEAA
jgi:hypothetical protein